jgi:hypothetical protein
MINQIVRRIFTIIRTEGMHGLIRRTRGYIKLKISKNSRAVGWD